MANSAKKQHVDTPGFESLGLDARLLQAIVDRKYSHPTAVQARAIPAILSGQDVLARSQTGSGKTAAYVLPLLQSMLQTDTISPRPALIILVPTKELAAQVTKVVDDFSQACKSKIQSFNLTLRIPDSVLRGLLAALPEVLVSTPGRLSELLKNEVLNIDSVKYLVVDEADLVLSYGYEEDMQVIAKALPDTVQKVLMSATLTAEVDSLKDLLCSSPTILDTKDAELEEKRMTQFAVRCAEDEKFLLSYVMFKLKLIKGKTIIFVGEIDRCYRLRLFLEQFGIRSCVLNAQLPVNTRLHIVEEFNKGVYDLIIAADENEILGEDEEESSRRKETDSRKAKEDDASDLDTKAHRQKAAEAVKKKKRAKRSSTRSREYGVSRGIDFQNVACVLNFDLPNNAKSYTHRIGRTARAGKTGMSLSFVIPTNEFHKHPPTSFAPSKDDETVMAAIVEDQQANGNEVQPYHFDMDQINSFRYRMNDALRAVTRVTVREARTREIKEELLKSEKLKRHFEENPQDLRHLVRHDGDLRTARVQPHLKHVPDYLLPSQGTKGLIAQQQRQQDLGFVGLRKIEGNRIRRARNEKRARRMKAGVVGKGKQKAGSRKDPLKSNRR